MYTFLDPEIKRTFLLMHGGPERIKVLLHNLRGTVLKTLVLGFKSQLGQVGSLTGVQYNHLECGANIPMPMVVEDR